MDEFPARKLDSLENDIGKVLAPLFGSCKTNASIVAYMTATKAIHDLKEILEKENEKIS